LSDYRKIDLRMDVPSMILQRPADALPLILIRLVGGSLDRNGMELTLLLKSGILSFQWPSRVVLRLHLKKPSVDAGR
jgi:hypothetical protein